jgi:AcrR family transcriptional regulator
MEAQVAQLGRQRILAEAERLFTEQGYEGVSIRAIAQACEVSNAALYYHFNSKAELFAEVLQRHTEELRDRMRIAMKFPGSLRQRLKAALGEYGAIVGDRQSPVFLLRRESGSACDDQLRERLHSLLVATLEPLEAILIDAQRQRMLRELPEGYSPAALLLGMLHGLVRHRAFCQGNQVTLEDISLVVDLFWDGFATKE